jgi:prepilin-type processing-associated H-X9-DG protein
MTDDARASEAMNAASYEARHSDDSIPALAAKVAGPMATGRREARGGTAYLFADGSVLLIHRKDGASFASEAKMDRVMA